MDEKTKTKLLKALRSGKYPQGQRQLVRTNGEGTKFYCCLGVLADVLGWPILENTVIAPDGNVETTSLGLNNRTYSKRDDVKPLSYLAQADLMQMNDDGKSFEEIATYIEERNLE
jgi:hypothetical protein